MLSLKTLVPFGLLTSAQILIAGFVIYYIGWIIYSRCFHPYHDIPGPFLASITQWWYFRTIRYGIAENSQLPLHKKYGKFVRIAPNEVSISDATAADIVYGVDPIWEKTEFYDSFSSRIADRLDTFSVRDEKVHNIARKKIAPLFTPGTVLEYEPCVDRVIDIFCQCMDGLAESKETFDISVWFRKYSFDVIGEMFYGKAGGFGFLRENIDYNGWMGMLDVMVPPVSSLGYIPKGMRTLYLMLQLAFSRETRKGLAAAKTVIEQSQAVVKERQDAIAAGTESLRNDYLSRLMKIVHDRGDKIDFNMQDVVVNVWAMIWAGSDTTGYVICGIFYHMLKTPRVYKKLVDEIQDAFAAGNLSFPIRYNSAMKLPYLSACIKEGMRISPATGTGFPRYVPEGGATIAGRYFPGGYKVILNPNVVHFDTECFGEDAEEFVPERWLQADEKKVAHMARHEIGFGTGPRVCLGKHISIIEMYKLLPAILHKFHFELQVPEWRVKNCWYRCPSDVNVKVLKR